MVLNGEKTKVLLAVVERSFDYMAAKHSNLQLLTPTNNDKILDADTVSKMSACLQFKDLASVIPVDADFVRGMNPDDFDMIHDLLSSLIRNLRKQMDVNYELDPDLANIVNGFFEERIMFLTDIQDDLQAMLEQPDA